MCLLSFNCFRKPSVMIYKKNDTISADGMHWGDFWKSPSPDQKMTIGHTILFLLGDGLVLTFLTWYTEAVYPGGEGVPQKPWFFVLVGSI